MVPNQIYFLEQQLNEATTCLQYNLNIHTLLHMPVLQSAISMISVKLKEYGFSQVFNRYGRLTLKLRKRSVNARITKIILAKYLIYGWPLQ